MTTITKFDRPACRTIADEAMDALQAVAEKHGLLLKKERGQYDTASYTFKVTFNCKTESGAPKNFERNAAALGMPKGCWGEVFEYSPGGTMYQLQGINLRARKYPVIAKRLTDDKMFKLEAGMVTLAIERKRKMAGEDRTAAR